MHARSLVPRVDFRDEVSTVSKNNRCRKDLVNRGSLFWCRQALWRIDQNLDRRTPSDWHLHCCSSPLGKQRHMTPANRRKLADSFGRSLQVDQVSALMS